MQLSDSSVEVRPGNQRGTFSNHWLHARFSLSFGDWRPRAGAMVYRHTIDGRGMMLVGGTGPENRLGAGDALAIHRADAWPIQVESTGPTAQFLIFEFAISSPA